MGISIDSSGDVETVKGILAKDGYKPFGSDYVTGTFINSEAFHSKLHPTAKIGSLGNFYKEADDGLHLVSILTDSSKPGRPFMVEFTASRQNVAKEAIRLAPLLTMPVPTFVAQHQAAPETPVIEIFDGFRRQGVRGNAAASALKLELEG